MKIHLIPIMFFLAACGGSTKNEAGGISTKADQIKEGEQLVNAGDCKTCHHQVNKIIGPAHLEVARRYDFTEANVKLLAGRIINGGSGVWGDIPMNPHPDLSVADAEKMARYVLSLDGEAEK